MTRRRRRKGASGSGFYAATALFLVFVVASGYFLIQTFVLKTPIDIYVVNADSSSILGDLTILDANGKSIAHREIKEATPMCGLSNIALVKIRVPKSDSYTFEFQGSTSNSLDAKFIRATKGTVFLVHEGGLTATPGLVLQC